MLTRSAEVLPLTRIQNGRWIAGQGRPQRLIPVPWRPLLVTTIFTGMRASELRGLRWPNVDLKAGVIRVRERADRYQKLGPPKTKAGRRDIPLAPMVINTLREWSLACPKNDKELVFPTERGTVIRRTNLLRQGHYPLLRAYGPMSEAAEDEAQPPYPFHFLRHAATALFIERGQGPKKFRRSWGIARSPGPMTFTATSSPHPTMIGRRWRDSRRGFSTEKRHERSVNACRVSCRIRVAPKCLAMIGNRYFSTDQRCGTLQHAQTKKLAVGRAQHIDL